MLLLAGDARSAELHGWGDLLDLAKFAAFFFWFLLLGKCLFRNRFSRFVVWLTALALPMHGYAAIAMDLRGPAHYHGAATESAPRHAHGIVERHFHAHGEAAIEVDDGDRSHESKATGPGKNGSAGGFDTQSPAPLRVPVQHPPAAVTAGEFRVASPPFPGRVERPPASAATPRFR